MQVTACDICSEPVDFRSMKVLVGDGYKSVDLCQQCSTAIRQLLEKHELLVKNELRVLEDRL